MTKRTFEIDLDDVVWKVFDVYTSILSKKEIKLMKLPTKKEKNEAVLTSILLTFLLDNYEGIINENNTEDMKLHEALKGVTSKYGLRKEDTGSSVREYVPKNTEDTAGDESVTSDGSRTPLLGIPK